MADKTYKMTVGLSNGTILDAGTFVAPQGPQGLRGATGPQGPEGPQGPAGGIGKWTEAIANDILEDGLYVIGINNMVGITEINNGQSAPILFALSIGTAAKSSIYTFGQVYGNTLSRYWKTSVVVEESGNIVFSREVLEVSTYKYIKLL